MDEVEGWEVSTPSTGLDRNAEDTSEALDEIVASSANAEEAATTREALEEIEVLLNQLKIEPIDAEELANKFKLFEGGLNKSGVVGKTLNTLRKQMVTNLLYS